MAIDILSRGTNTPIIVGDDEDLGLYRRCYLSRRDGKPGLVLCEDNADPSWAESGLHTSLSEGTGRSFLQNEFALLVSLSKSDEIIHAYLTPINDPLSPIRMLSNPEIKTLAEELVAGDFQLDFLR